MPLVIKRLGMVVALGVLSIFVGLIMAATAVEVDCIYCDGEGKTDCIFCVGGTDDRLDWDSKSTKVLRILPSFISLRLTAGTQLISVSRVITPLEISSLAVSTTTIFGLISFAIINSAMKRKQRTLKTISTTNERIFNISSYENNGRQSCGDFDV